jgi:FKBP-type peptidyl-prolyl cis-trans isomerase SlpA
MSDASMNETTETPSGLRPGDTVTLHYRLSCQGDEVISTFEHEPETFALGSGDMEPRLESLLLSLQAGQHLVFELDPGEGFGARDEALVHNLSRGDFIGMDLQVGHGIEFNLPNGQRMMGGVLAVTENEVKVDFNHPLAGLPVTFEVQILATQAA